MQKRNATVAVVGAGDYIGAAIARKFAAEGFTVFAGRRNGKKLEPPVKEVAAAGGTIVGRSLDARKKRSPLSSMRLTKMRRSKSPSSMSAPTSIFRSWRPPTASFERSGKWRVGPASSRAANRRLMLPRGQGNIFFTGATASLRGGSGFAAFAIAKFGLRAVAQSMARELGPKNIHVAHLIIDSGVDTAWVRERREQLWGKEARDDPDLLMPPASVAASCW